MPRQFLQTISFLAVLSTVYFSFLTLQGNPVADLAEEAVTPPNREIPILMYHYVEYGTPENDTLRKSLNISPEIFEKQLLTLKDAGYRFITPSEIPTAFTSSPETKYAIITFDDGYRTFHTYPFPILKKHNIRAVNYVVSGFIDLANWLTSEQLKEIGGSGLVEIGGHGMYHKDLTKISEHAARVEIEEGRRVLEENLGTDITTFAYPNGDYNETIINLVRDAGFSSAVTTEEGAAVFSHSGVDAFTLKRIRPGYLTGEALLELVSGKSPGP